MAANAVIEIARIRLIPATIKRSLLAGNHGHTHARSNVELSAGDPQTEKHSSHGKYRDQQHREGNAKTFVKKEQEKKNEKNCCDQNDGETAEGDLLLFVKPAESVEHVVWNDAGFGQSAFHIANR